MTVRIAGSTWNPLGRQTEDRMRAHNIWCLHTMAGSFAGTNRMFHDGGYDGTESHQGVRADGYDEQWQDLAFTADANLDGNGEVISTETEDYGGVFGKWDLNDPAQIPAWTAAQCAKLIATGVQLCLPGTDPRSAHRDCPRDWACYREGIPPFLIPDTRRGRRGIGYHAQGVPGVGLVPGGVQWSKARGKQCPGARRIAQLKAVVIPGIQAALKQSPEEDDMTPEQDRLLRELHDRLYGIFPQRYYVADPDGRWREVDADTPGAKPARGLDELHGNVIVTDVRAAVSAVSSLSKATAAGKADPAAIAAAVVDAVGTGVAAQVVDALAARLSTKAGA